MCHLEQIFSYSPHIYKYVITSVSMSESTMPGLASIWITINLILATFQLCGCSSSDPVTTCPEDCVCGNAVFQSSHRLLHTVDCIGRLHAVPVSYPHDTGLHVFNPRMAKQVGSGQNSLTEFPKVMSGIFSLVVVCLSVFECTPNIVIFSFFIFSIL